MTNYVGTLKESDIKKTDGKGQNHQNPKEPFLNSSATRKIQIERILIF